MKSIKILIILLGIVFYTPNAFTQNKLDIDSLEIKLRQNIKSAFEKKQIDNMPVMLEKYHSVVQEINDSIGLGRHLFYKGFYWQSMGDIKKAEALYWASLNIYFDLKIESGINTLLNHIFSIYHLKELTDSCIKKQIYLTVDSLQKAKNCIARNTYIGTVSNLLINLKKTKEASGLLNKGFELLSSNDTIGLIMLKMQKAFLRLKINDYSEAIKTYKETEALSRKISNSTLQFESMSMIGYIYSYINEYDMSIEIYQKIVSNIDKSNMLYSQAYNNIGDAYMKKGEYNKALNYILKSKEINERDKHKSLLYYNIVTLSEIYLSLNEYDKAILYTDTAIQLTEGERGSYAYSQNIMGEIYLAQKKYKQAEKAFNITLDFLNYYFMEDMALKLYKNLSDLYENTNQLKKSLLYHRKYDTLKDSVLSAESLSKVNSLNTVLEIERIEKENQNLKTLQKLGEATIQRQQIFQYALIIGILLIVVALIFFVRGNRIKNKANANLLRQRNEIAQKNKQLEKSQEEIKSQNEMLFTQNEEIKTQNEEILAQNDEILTQKEVVENHKNILEIKNLEISDSIAYARKIQQAVIPSHARVSELIEKNFVYWKPRNVVSGDFYWVDKYENTIVVAAADSTGHGVPGAFMSMLGMAFLNDILHTSKEFNPATILDRMRLGIKQALNQTNALVSQKDGMDIALCVLDLKERKMNYAGAYNSVYIFRKNNEIIEIKADKQPVGVHFKEKPFTNNSITLKKSDRIYLFTDGFTDQFGGKKGGKYLKQKFIEYLLSIQETPITQQRDLIRQEYKNWTMEQYEQLDDILVMGIEID